MSGDLVMDAKCPGCKEHTVVYDGNYYCNDESGCGWVMGETKNGHVRKRDKKIVAEYLNQRFEEAEEVGDTQTMETMKFYMERQEGP